MRKVIYTCVTGAYDSLRQPCRVDPSYDYICFSDTPSGKRDGVWNILPIPFTCPDKTRQSRFVKLQPHKVLQDYDVSVWMDANITITGESFYEALERKVDSGCLVSQVPHLSRDCVYEEIVSCYKDMRISLRDAVRQFRHLKAEGFPPHFGLWENNVIFRRHNDPRVRRISDAWWNEYMSYSKRDQLALVPVYWKEGFTPEPLFGDGVNSRNARCLEIVRHPSTKDAGVVSWAHHPIIKMAWSWRRVMAALFLGR